MATWPHVHPLTRQAPGPSFKCSLCAVAHTGASATVLACKVCCEQAPYSECEECFGKGSSTLAPPCLEHEHDVAGGVVGATAPCAACRRTQPKGCKAWVCATCPSYVECTACGRTTRSRKT
jgi:hypothetical protein